MKRTIAMAVLCGATLGACGRGYSDGERVGTIYKFSRKGLFWKSWEGEMNLGGVRKSDDGAVANVWAFTVTDPTLVPFIESALALGQPTRIKYTQWMLSPCSMGSSYEVTGVLALSAADGR
jgi:hypothetical protein